MFPSRKLVVFVLFLTLVYVSGQSYEDKRCICICPSPAAVLNTSLSTDRKLFISIVSAAECNCDGVIIPGVGQEIKGREHEFCPHCDCKFQTRNTFVIKVVVIMVVWMMTLLLIYVGFLRCLHPLVTKNGHYNDNLGNHETRNLLLRDNEE